MRTKIEIFFKRNKLCFIVALVKNYNLDNESLILIVESIKNNQAHLHCFFNCLNENKVLLKRLTVDMEMMTFFKNFSAKYCKENQSTFYLVNFHSKISSPLQLETVCKKYKTIENCIEHLISQNQIVWSYELIKLYSSQSKHYNYSVWESISRSTDVFWTEKIFEEFTEQLQWVHIAGNEAVCLTEKILFNFLHKFDHTSMWFWLAKHSSTIWTYKMVLALLEFNHKIQLDFNDSDYLEWFTTKSNVQWSEEFFNLAYSHFSITYKSPLPVYLNIKVPWTIGMIRAHKENIEWHGLCQRNDVPWLLVMREFPEYIYWDVLSKNESIFWEMWLIEEFENYINFKSLSNNKSVEWNDTLILKYINKWEWGGINYMNPNRENIINGLTNNTSIIWTRKTILQFQNYLSIPLLSLSENVYWTEELLEEFSNLWDIECSYYKGKPCASCPEEEVFFSPFLIRNKKAVFSKPFLLKNFDYWDSAWREYRTYVGYKPKVEKLEGKEYDANNEIWKHLSYNLNLDSELIIYFKDFWDYEILLENKSIIWNIELLLSLEKKLCNTFTIEKDYSLFTFWSSSYLFNQILEKKINKTMINLIFDERP